MYRLGDLINHFQFDMNDFDSPLPLGVKDNTLVIVSDASIFSNSVILNGYLAETIIDERTSVIPTRPDDSILFEDIAIPENKFILELTVVNGSRNIRFIEFNGAPL